MTEKWKRAQVNEAKFWVKKKQIILSAEYRNVIKMRALRVENWLKRKISFKNTFNILEIGGGGTQLIDYFGQANRFEIDPLAAFYIGEFFSVLNPEVKWLEAKVEDLPFPDQFFDIIVSRNALDHVGDFCKALDEIKRVMKKDAVFYLGMNTMYGPLYLFRKFKKSIEHPFVFSDNTLRYALNRVGFRIIDNDFDSVENMKDFTELIFENKFRNLLHKILLYLNSYHFSEFILKK